MFYINMVNVLIVGCVYILREQFLMRTNGTLVSSMYVSNCKKLAKYVILGGHGMGAALIWSNSSDVPSLFESDIYV